MVVDAELGMPLDLSHWDCLWNDKLDDSGVCAIGFAIASILELNPNPKNAPLIDLRDAFMLKQMVLRLHLPRPLLRRFHG